MDQRCALPGWEGEMDKAPVMLEQGKPRVSGSLIPEAALERRGQ